MLLRHMIFLGVFAGTCSQEETKNECLKSLMATYLYPKMILDYTNDGVNFKEHLYVLEFDPRTGEYFHEREDHIHVLKRIANCARAGDVPDVDAKTFVDALHDPSSGLTYTVCTCKPILMQLYLHVQLTAIRGFNDVIIVMIDSPFYSFSCLTFLILIKSLNNFTLFL